MLNRHENVTHCELRLLPPQKRSYFKTLWAAAEPTGGSQSSSSDARDVCVGTGSCPPPSDVWDIRRMCMCEVIPVLFSLQWVCSSVKAQLLGICYTTRRMHAQRRTATPAGLWLGVLKLKVLPEV